MKHGFVCAVSALLLALGSTTSPSEHDDERRRAVDEINSKPGLLWTAGLSPRFQGMPVGSVKDLCGVKSGGKERLRARVAAGTLKLLPRKANLNIPDDFDSAKNWPQCAKVIGDIRDQSACGCCWAFGAAEAASDRLCIATNGTVALPLSAQETCFCAQDDGCNGGQLETAWEYIQQTGLSTGAEYQNTGPFGDLGLCSQFSLPHCHHHGPQGTDPYPDEGTKGCPNVAEDMSPKCPTACDSSAKPKYSNFAKDRYGFSGDIQTVDTDADTIAEQIMKHGPMEASFTVYDDFEHYVSGIYSTTSTKSMGGHAIKIVGFGVDGGVKYWKVQNSWNPHWGEGGYFRIKRGSDECGIEDQVMANSGESQWTGPGLAPGPAPTPPTPGQCEREMSRADCVHTSEGGKACKWCPLVGVGPETCQKAEDCDDPPENVVVV